MIHILLIIALVGLLIWAVNTYVPMQDGIKKLFNVVAVVCLILWLLSSFGVISGFHPRG